MMIIYKMAANFSTGPPGALTTDNFDMGNVQVVAFLRQLRGSDGEEDPYNDTESPPMNAAQPISKCHTTQFD